METSRGEGGVVDDVHTIRVLRLRAGVVEVDVSREGLDGHVPQRESGLVFSSRTWD